MTVLNSQQQADVARYIREHGNKTVISPEWSLIYFSLCQCELHQSHEAIIFHNGRPAGLFLLNETGELTELYLLGSISDILTAAAVSKYRMRDACGGDDFCESLDLDPRSIELLSRTKPCLKIMLSETELEVIAGG
ncbi:hypothetical protein ACFWZG_003555 [Salmonella enterica]|uniref:hypothetical protein n=1 Tax=Salmonella enterica TaxID=28901 RepID=UPI003A91744B